jgi:hypothetical protein
MECTVYLLLRGHNPRHVSIGDAPTTAPTALSEKDAAAAAEAEAALPALLCEHLTRGFDAWLTDDSSSSSSSTTPCLRDRVRSPPVQSAAVQALARSLAQLNRSNSSTSLVSAAGVWPALQELLWSRLQSDSPAGARWTAQLLAQAVALAAEAAERRGVTAAAVAAVDTDAEASSTTAGDSAASESGLLQLCRALFAHCLHAGSSSSSSDSSSSSTAPPAAHLLVFMAELTAALGAEAAQGAAAAAALRTALHSWIAAASQSSPELLHLLALLQHQLQTQSAAAAAGVPAASADVRELVCTLLGRSGQLRAVAGSGLRVAASVLQCVPASLQLQPVDAAQCVDAPALAVMRGTPLLQATDSSSGSISSSVSSSRGAEDEVVFLQTSFGYWSGQPQRQPFITAAAAAELCAVDYSVLVRADCPAVRALLPVLASKAHSAAVLLNGVCSALLIAALAAATESSTTATAATATAAGREGQLWSAYAEPVLRCSAARWQAFADRFVSDATAQLSQAESADAADAQLLRARISAQVLEVVQLESAFGAVHGGVLLRLGVTDASAWSTDRRAALWQLTVELLQRVGRSADTAAAAASERLSFLQRGTAPAATAADSSSDSNTVLTELSAVLWAVLTAGAALGERVATLTLAEAAAAAGTQSRVHWRGGLGPGLWSSTDFGALTDAALLPQQQPAAQIAALLLPQEPPAKAPLLQEGLAAAWQQGVRSAAAAAAADASIDSVSVSVCCESVSSLARAALGTALARCTGPTAGALFAQLTARLQQHRAAGTPLRAEDISRGQLLLYSQGLAGDAPVHVVDVHTDPAGGEPYVTVKHADGWERQTELRRLSAAPQQQQQQQAVDALQQLLPCSAALGAAASELLLQVLLPLDSSLHSSDVSADVDRVCSVLTVLRAAAPVCVRTALALDADAAAALLPALDAVWTHWCGAAVTAAASSSEPLSARLSALAAAVSVLSAVFAGTPYLSCAVTAAAAAAAADAGGQQGDTCVTAVLHAVDTLLQEAHMYEDSGDVSESELLSCGTACLTFVAEAAAADGATGSSSSSEAPLALMESIVMSCQSHYSSTTPTNSTDSSSGCSSSTSSDEQALPLLRALAGCLACESARATFGASPALSAAIKRAAVDTALPLLLNAAQQQQQQLSHAAAQQGALCCRLLCDLAADDYCVVRGAAEARAVWGGVTANAQRTDQLYALLQRTGAPALQACAYQVLAAAASCAVIEPPAVESDSGSASSSSGADDDAALDANAAAAEAREMAKEYAVVRR